METNKQDFDVLKAIANGFLFAVGASIFAWVAGSLIRSRSRKDDIEPDYCYVTDDGSEVIAGPDGLYLVDYGDDEAA